MLALLSVLFCAPVTGFSYSPMFMWSGLNYFTDKNVYVNEAVSSSLLGPLIKTIATQSVLPGFEDYMAGTENQSPKVILVALYDRLTTEEVSGLARTGGLHSLQNVLDSSASSLVVPYTYSNSTDADSLTTSLRSQFGEVQEASSADILSATWIKDLTSKGDTAVVQVMMDEAQPDMLSKATAALDQATDGKYLLVLSTKTASIVSAARASSRHLLANPGPMPRVTMCNHEDEHFDEQTLTCFRYVYMTPAIMWGIFIGVFGFFTLYLALMCLHGVQTPDVWLSKDDPGPAKGKEF